MFFQEKFIVVQRVEIFVQMLNTFVQMVTTLFQKDNMFIQMLNTVVPPGEMCVNMDRILAFVSFCSWQKIKRPGCLPGLL